MPKPPSWLSEKFPELTEVGLLGQGAHKWVYAARHPTEGSVVLKVIRPEAAAERIRREILAVSKVASPRVPRIFDHGDVDSPDGPVLWIREQRIVGSTVRVLIQAGPFPTTEVLRLGLHVLEALADVERARIVHRDVKPDNVIRADDGDFWLLDFGIARHLGLSSLTATHLGFGLGTPGYAPPEQFRNKKREIDARADLFALAVTLVECATGRNQFRDGVRDGGEACRRVESQPLVVAVAAWDRGGSFAEVVKTMGQLRVGHRPRTARDALDWFREVCAGHGV